VVRVAGRRNGHALLMRPAQHGLHDARGVHSFTFGNFALWDLMLGTFRNPVDFPAAYGFWDGASSKVGAMLIGRDVSEPA
jgi:hypothetical protein